MLDGTPIIVKRKRVVRTVHHGGSWKVAYADFVTAMMAFFMVMWIMGLSDDTRAQIQGYFNDPVGFVKSRPQSSKIVAIDGVPTGKIGQRVQRSDQAYQDDRQAMHDLKANIEKAMAADPDLGRMLQHVDVQITEDGLRIEFIEDKNDFFESGSDALKPGAVHLIHLLGPKLANSGRQLIIEGHTDAAPFAGDPLGNFGLSAKRAWALASALGASGVSERHLRSVSGLGDTHLADPKHPTSARNRRVTILLPYETPVTAVRRLPKEQLGSEIADRVLPKLDLKPPLPDFAR